MQLLRVPVARATTAALVPEAAPDAQAEIGDLVLGWIDSLAPIISARRPPRRWSRVARAEVAVSDRLVERLGAAGCEAPRGTAAALAAGIQVPIAAGAWCLTQLASHPEVLRRLRDQPATAEDVVWETLRLYPPSWLLPRIATEDVVIGTTPVSAYTPLIVSPFALGRLPEVCPGPEQGQADLDVFEPERWRVDGARPGAWLPFGVGAHACPGRSLGLALLADLVRWAAALDLLPQDAPGIDASRGLAPTPSVVGLGTCPHQPVVQLPQ
nr:cytochrome P450 [Nocardioides luti]